MNLFRHCASDFLDAREDLKFPVESFLLAVSSPSRRRVQERHALALMAELETQPSVQDLSREGSTDERLPCTKATQPLKTTHLQTASLMSSHSSILAPRRQQQPVPKDSTEAMDMAWNKNDHSEPWHNIVTYGYTRGTATCPCDQIFPRGKCRDQIEQRHNKGA